MSEAVLPLTLLATFAAVALAGLAVEAAVASRLRAVRLLRSQVASTTLQADLREQTLSRPFADRVLGPVLGGFGRIARRLTPIDMRARLAHKLVLAGSPAGWDAERVAAMKIAGVVGGALLGMADARLLGWSGVRAIGFTVLLAAVGYLAPDAILSGRARIRQDAIQRSLPDTMDLLTISVEAGLGLDAALAQVARNTSGPLADEIARLLQEVQLNVTRQQAFRNLADRTDVDDIRGFALAMIQADIFGVSIGNVLRAQSRDLRTKRRQRAERKAMQTPVKILFPLIFCVMPALFVVLGGPAAIRIFNNFLGG